MMVEWGSYQFGDVQNQQKSGLGACDDPVASQSDLAPLRSAANAFDLSFGVSKESHHYPTRKSPHHLVLTNGYLFDAIGVDA